VEISVGELAQKLSLDYQGDATIQLNAVCDLENAKPGGLSFLSSSKYRKFLAHTQASAVILTAEDAQECPEHVVRLISNLPYLAYARAAQILYPTAVAKPGIHPSALIDEAAAIDPTAEIGPNVVIGAGAVIAAGVIIRAGCVIGADVLIGEATIVAANVILLDRVQIGKRCEIHPAAVIGSEGFGFANDAGTWVRIPQIGTVVIGDDVEIGANTTIDRGAVGNTIIGDGVKLDNLIQIAHNVSIGNDTAIAACTGIAGSAKIGARCAIGGNVGVVGHLHIVDDVVITGRTFVAHNIEESGTYSSGAKIGVLGYNGAGKSTLLKIMAGLDTDIIGEARAQPGINIGYLPQEPQLNPDKDVRGNVEEGLSVVKDAQEALEKVYAAYAESDADFDALAAEQARLENIVQSADGHNLERKLEIAADALRLPAWDADVSKLSGGERRRVALCRLLLSSPDMLILDEPTNHLDAESVAWLERFLQEYTGTVVAVTHDRYFLDNVAGWILELDRGHGIPWEGNYSSWLEQKERRLEQEKNQEAARIKSMKQELEWVRSNPKGRQAKSKARLKRFEEISSSDYQERSETSELYIPPGPRLGDMVIEASDLKKSFGDRVLYENLSFNLPRGGIVGVIGPNGAGKSTLFRMLVGQETPDSGEIKVGKSVELAYVDQSRDSLDGSKTVWEEISDGQDIIKIGNYEVQSRAYVGRFNFRGNGQQKRIGDLSGGERNRVHLAKLLRTGGNLLLLDEPTNDLDVETLRALEEALLNFPGCAVVISHDRWFLDRIATHILAFEGDSSATWFEGNYSEYEEDHLKRLGDTALTPERIKYKKLA
jgi:ATP-binding cassette ChvD family protein